MVLKSKGLIVLVDAIDCLMKIINFPWFLLILDCENACHGLRVVLCLHFIAFLIYSSKCAVTRSNRTSFQDNYRIHLGNPGTMNAVDCIQIWFQDSDSKNAMKQNRSDSFSISANKQYFMCICKNGFVDLCG